ncbi:hypothetical protein [Amycolatopsis japonica]
MAIDTKYGRVTLENGTIGEDEPVFVLRAQDALTPEVLAEYRRLCAVAGSPAKHLEGIDAAAHAVIEWQQGHHTQVPQSAG